MKRQLLWCSAFLASAIMVSPIASLTAQDVPMAQPADVGSIDAIMTAVYDVISGPAGPRDWDRFRSLFAPGAQLIPTGRSQTTGEVGANRNTVREFIDAASGSFSREPFFEVETNRVTERYGNIAHAFSTYESRRSLEEEPFVRGINSFQLLYDGDRWWVVNIYWADENLSGPIPDKYTPGH